MKRFTQGVWWVLVLVMALVFVGCAQPPEAEKSAAKAAMDAAVAAGADKYATADFNTAKDVWGKAELQMNEKKYEQAKKTYGDAKAAFEKATAAAAAGKKAMTDEVNAAIAVLEEGGKNLEASASQLKNKMKDKKEEWETAVKTYTDGLAEVKAKVATDPFAAKTRVGELKSLQEKWDAVFKELAAAPAKPGKKGKK